MVGRRRQHLDLDVLTRLAPQGGGDDVDHERGGQRTHGPAAELVVQARQVVGHRADAVDFFLTDVGVRVAA